MPGSYLIPRILGFINLKMQLQDILDKVAQTKVATILDRRFGDHRIVIELLASTIMKDNLSGLDSRLSSEEILHLDSSLCRYFILHHLVKEGHLTQANLQGYTIDIGCHLGQSTDGIAMFGGGVYGTDINSLADRSVSGNIRLDAREGISAVREHVRAGVIPNLVTCFNAAWVESMSRDRWCLELYDACMAGMKPGGEVLLSFGQSYKHKGELIERSMHEVQVPGLLRIREQYVLVGRK